MDKFKEQQLKVMTEGIKPPDEESRQACKRRWDNIAKPIGGLGRFEDMIAQIAAIQHSPDVRLERKALVIFCADNGIVKEGVSQTDSSVTAIVTDNFAKGLTSANVLAACADVDIFPVDIGVAGTVGEPGIIDAKIIPGTADFLKSPAMSRENALDAILTGIQCVSRLKDMGYDIIAAGEMGIGNTTTSSAMASVLLGLSPEEVTGRGAGLSDEGLSHKTEVIREGIALHRPDPRDVLGLLSCLGGLDIAGICGLMLGGAIYGVPIVMDGLVSAVAALTAARLAPLVTDYLLPSHEGREPACHRAMEALGLCPVIHASLALGEGSGALLLFPLLSMAEAVYEQNTTFGDIEITPYRHFDTGKDGQAEERVQRWEK